MPPCPEDGKAKRNSGTVGLGIPTRARKGANRKPCAHDGAGGEVVNMLGGGIAEAAGGGGFPHAEAGDQPSVEDVAEVEVEVLGGEEGS
jgi:hypothetical protein